MLPSANQRTAVLIATQICILVMKIVDNIKTTDELSKVNNWANI